jgi:hypothetical protein
LGWSLARKHLEHFLNGDGEDTKEVKRFHIMRDQASAKAYNEMWREIKEDAEDWISTGNPMSIKSDYRVSLGGEEHQLSRRLRFALGKYDLVAITDIGGYCSDDKHCARIRVHFELGTTFNGKSLGNEYDFDQQGMNGIASGFNDAAFWLQKHDYAKTFMMYTDPGWYEYEDVCVNAPGIDSHSEVDKSTERRVERVEDVERNGTTKGRQK